jgi:hypothetical protein
MSKNKQKFTKQMRELRMLYAENQRWINLNLLRPPWYERTYRKIRLAYRRWRFKRMLES